MMPKKFRGEFGVAGPPRISPTYWLACINIAIIQGVLETVKNALALIGLVFSVSVALVTLWRAFHGRLKVSARATYTTLHDKLLQDMQPRLHWISPSFYELDISNRGKVEVKDLILSIPCDGIFTTSRPPVAEKEFNQQIELGALRPKSRLKVKVWIKDAHWHDLKDVCLTHSGVGDIPIRDGVIVFSALAKGIDSFGQPTRYTLGIILILGCVMSLISLILSAAHVDHGRRDAAPPGASTLPAERP